MHVASISLLVCLLIIPCSADSNKKFVHLKKVAAEIKIDGVIDHSWVAADSVADFFQLQPYFGKNPSRRTIAKVITDDEALYCLIVCYDHSENIQVNTGTLDESGGDIVSIMLDTFGDRRTAYKFAVSASGVRSDCRLLDDARNRDYNWDGVWFADSKVYEWGFVTEMKIPYRSIQYDEKLMEWGLDFDRWIASNKEDLYWCNYEENEGQRISKFGRLIFDGFRPSVQGLNLEIYPVALAKASYIGNDKYKIDPDVGIDLFYNPSQKLTFQLTANPDFAQIEADPFDFNISRYETYFNERRPFFTQGNEIFMPAGRQRNTGFYRPLELFYSRRIGRKLPDGSEVPLLAGTKAFGRIDDWEYGGFLALTDEKDYSLDDSIHTEPRAYFASARLKKQILGNSSIGLLFVGKHSEVSDDGVLDLDGAFRGSDWQLAYQVARSFKNNEGGWAISGGYSSFKPTWFAQARLRSIDSSFDANQVGYVPWRGTVNAVALGGPRWYFEEGAIRECLLYVGAATSYEKADLFTDWGFFVGGNMNFRSNWGYELTFNFGESKDGGVKYSSTEVNASSWFYMSPKWNGNIWGGYSKTYNFSREFLASYVYIGSEFSWRPFDILQAGASLNAFIEGNPQNEIEDITYNMRPYLSLTPMNDLNVRFYVDNVFVRSTDHLEQLIVGFLFSYNFLTKSWIYFAINELQDRADRYDAASQLLPKRMHVQDRAAVLKIKYLYYF